MRFVLPTRVVLFLLLASAIAACSTNDASQWSPYSPPSGPGGFGQSCSKTEDCATLLCVRVDPTGGVCTHSCTTDQDCPAAINWQCLQPPDLSHPICACVRDPSQSCLNGVDNDCNGVVDQCQTCNGASVSLNDPDNCGGCGIVCGSDQRCTSGHCECAAQGTTACGTACVDTQNDPGNCGGCGKTCASGMGCVQGACACSDPSRPNACGTLCTSLATDDGNCGSCGTVCLGGTSCSSGSCKCPAAASTNCGGTCVDTGTDPNNCGACGHGCSGQQSCVNGACTCPASTPELCGSSCVDPSTDGQNCGACGVKGNWNQSCVGGACTCPSSAPSLCSGLCTDTSTDTANCGACGVACGVAQLCQGGTCGCFGAGLTICAGVCVDTSSDTANCGACGNVCATGDVCAASACSCTSGVFCGSVCEPVNDSNNCGACGHACGANQVCSTGACVCSTGFTSCSGSCVDTQTDAANCGACGHVCPASASCSVGSCICNASGLTACGTACVDLQTDVTNCGACGVTCAGREQCVSGACSCGNPIVGTATDLGLATGGVGPPALGGFGWDGTHIGVAFERVADSYGPWAVADGSVWFSLLNPDGSRAIADQVLSKFVATGTDALLPAPVAFNGTQWAAFWINENGDNTSAMTMWVQRFATSGAAIGSPVNITPTLPATQYVFSLRVVWSQPAGTYVGIYETRDTSAYTTAIYVQPLGADGTQPGTAVTTNTSVDLVQAVATPAGAIGVLQSGGLTIVDATGTRLQPDVTYSGGRPAALANDGTAWIVAWATYQPTTVVVHRIASGANDLVIPLPAFDTVDAIGLEWSGSTGALTYRYATTSSDQLFLERLAVSGSSPVALTGAMQLLPSPAAGGSITVLTESLLMPTGATSFLAGWTNGSTFPVEPVDVSACP